MSSQSIEIVSALLEDDELDPKEFAMDAASNIYKPVDDLILGHKFFPRKHWVSTPVFDGLATLTVHAPKSLNRFQVELTSNAPWRPGQWVDALSSNKANLHTAAVKLLRRNLDWYYRVKRGKSLYDATRELPPGFEEWLWSQTQAHDLPTDYHDQTEETVKKWLEIFELWKQQAS